ncbi:uncharacterized protein LOC125478007 [Pyrus x bretschneideri]|uniref:uncharacterized protein LOC125478007 n=1 Tax=Pyrus x bretschneideri TaxID=225117 RepID=UPI0020308D04|nr:uncharacterized protein LOC125478007 [Pyrus x bretschneideri]
MIKWAIALGEFDISYQPKPAEKSQAVAHFIAEFTYSVDISPKPEALASLPSEAGKVKPTFPVWTLYVNGSSNQQGCGARLVIITPDKVALEYAFRFKFKASNNEVTNNFDDKDNFMAAFLAQTQLLLKYFHYQITQVPRVANSHAYALARLASAVEDKIGRKIHVELLAAPSTMVVELFTPIISPWPFTQWGLDLIGPMSMGKGKFDNKKFRIFCSKFNINLCFASPAHPQANGQVEAINKMIKRTLKTNLDKAKGYWPELVPQVLWSYRTSYRTSTGETPFSLAFGIEAIVPIELEQATHRVQNYMQSENKKQLTLNLDLVEEHRDQAHLRNVAYKQRISNYYDSRVKLHSLKVEDRVLKKILLCNKVPSEGTLNLNWDRPFEVVSISCPNS